MSSRGRPWAREHERKQVGPPDRDVDDLRGVAGLWGGMRGWVGVRPRGNVLHRLDM